jgi:hypothetical protein
MIVAISRELLAAKRRLTIVGHTSSSQVTMPSIGVFPLQFAESISSLILVGAGQASQVARSE